MWTTLSPEAPMFKKTKVKTGTKTPPPPTPNKPAKNPTIVPNNNKNTIHSKVICFSHLQTLFYILFDKRDDKLSTLRQFISRI
jgi:hypothetical protein